MATSTTDLTTLKINYLTQAQYEAALAQGQISENELYFTPDGYELSATDDGAGTVTLSLGLSAYDDGDGRSY